MLRKSLEFIFVSISTINIFKKNISCKIILKFNLFKLLTRKRSTKQLR